MKNKIFILMFAFILIGLSFVSASVIYESYAGSEDIAWGGGNYPQNYESQPFTVGNTGLNENFYISMVACKMIKTGSPTQNYDAFIRADNGANTPTGAVLSNGSMTNAQITNGAMAYWNMTAYLMHSSTKYHFIINSTTGDASNRYSCMLDTSAPTYTGGILTGTSDGSNWVAVGADSDMSPFEIWGYSPNPINITATLNSPSNGATILKGFINFSASFQASFNLVNSSYYIWNSTGLFNKTTIAITANNFTSTLINVSTIDNYHWNVEVCGNNVTDVFCNYSVSNRTFAISTFAVNYQNYTEPVIETQTQTMSINVTSDGVYTLLANLIYNGTAYPASMTGTSTSSVFTRTFTTPISPKGNNTFYWSFIYGGVQTNTTATNQNVTQFNLLLCNATYPTKALNFTLYDEQNLTIIKAVDNPINFQVNFNYWIGDGSIKKNYSYSVTGDNINSNYLFCINPNLTFQTDAQVNYQASLYTPNNYVLNNASLSNVTSIVPLYSLLATSATKFYVTVRQGVTYLNGAVVTVSRYVTGSGTYLTDSINLADVNAKFPLYAIIDGLYRFSIVRNGVLLGTIDTTASCASAPCSIDLNLKENLQDPFEGYREHFANNTASTLVYNPTTKIVTYNFLDVTGLAHYFRLVVTKTSFNSTTETICDVYSYSSSGTLTCDMTGQDGDFTATGYLSRSPETVDEVLSFIISSNLESLGMMGVFLNFAILLTMIVVGAVMSRGNPSTILIVLGLTVLGLKIITLFPFSWIIVSLIEIMIIFILTKLKT